MQHLEAIIGGVLHGSGGSTKGVDISAGQVGGYEKF